MTAPGLSAIGQIGSTVRDLDRAVRFYRDVLGLPLLFTAPPGLAFFDCAGVRLMIALAEDGAANRASSPVYFRVDDIRRMHETLVARGVVFSREPQCLARLPDREVWMAFFDDGEGNTLALMSEPRL